MKIIVKNMGHQAIMVSMLVYVVLMVSVQPCHAYLDPGTGSMILQGILGGLAALAVVGRLFWQRILNFFGVRKEDALVDAQKTDTPEYTRDQAGTVPVKTGKPD